MDHNVLVEMLRAKEQKDWSLDGDSPLVGSYPSTVVDFIISIIKASRYFQYVFTTILEQREAYIFTI
ncbi:hypothetical protein [Psychrobacillus sp. OK032]|uniref:hypothetical protein n=1 Tax=Psychrobacillus sp. OK032 TaxID=1884358 RepID=UPI0011605355|nr:hypothetical protein [Psychrobacillus sp. OK032]